MENFFEAVGDEWMSGICICSGSVTEAEVLYNLWAFTLAEGLRE